jgi:hypothetical protein
MADLLQELVKINEKSSPVKGSEFWIMRGERYLSGLPTTWTSFGEKAFVFPTKASATALIKKFANKDLKGAYVREHKL